MSASGGEGPSGPAAGDSIFLDRGGRLAELTVQPYLSEADLQRLVADHPDLLAGGQIDPASPRRWLLVAREMAVASEEDGPRRWSLDHLFLDQDGTPTLVEVKRSGDIRIRREVVGQMLDYAANAVAHWPVEQVRARFEARASDAGLDPVAELGAFLGEGGDAEALWSAVKTNLQAGRIRLIFVADVIPPELRRVVEFLNGQMDPAEVLAVEIRQYVGDGLRTLVPRVVGQTAGAQRRKSAGGRATASWDEPSFLGVLEERAGRASAEVARRLLGWAKTKGRVWYGSGERDGSLGLVVSIEGTKRYLFAANTRGTVEIYFQWLRNAPPFDGEATRQELLVRLNAIEGVGLPADKIGGRPSFPLATLVPPDRLRRFTAALDWVVDELRAASAGGSGPG